MKVLLSILIFLISFYVESETIYFDSNKSGMILDEITSDSIEEFYIKKDIDTDLKINTLLFYEDKKILKKQIEYYNDSFNELSKVLYIENTSEIEEIYSNNLVSNVITKDKGIIESIENLYYTDDNRLTRIEKFDGNNNLIYKDIFYRNSSGSLRKLTRESSDGYFSYWLYQNNLLIEYWLVKNNSATRTLYNSDGTFSEVVNYIDEKEVSKEIFTYRDMNIINSIKTGNNITVYKDYNDSGLIKEERTLEAGVLKKKINYNYIEGILKSELLTGHGKREEIVYNRDSDNEILSINYYINDELKKINSITDEESEIIIYYRNNEIYLKEFYYQDELIKKDLYLNGKIFKSENIDE